jgi:DNA repair protein RecN (Recombination protein N)
MLVELAVRDLGVIREARIPLGGGLVALTGETGAGKTMVVEALHLLCGGRPDPARVRPGATEAVVEGLVVAGDEEWVLRRVVPAAGRSRAYVNGELATAAYLAELAGGLIEIHGQHAQQALLTSRAQRDALDRFAGVDPAPLRAARRSVAELRQRLEELGGDERARAREIDLLRHQLAEIDVVAPVVGEDEDLSVEEDRLADAVAHREAGASAHALLSGDGAAIDLVARSRAELDRRRPYDDLLVRLVSLAEELTDVAAEVRDRADGIVWDDERLAAVRARRQLLAELRRKYGDRVEDVLDFAAETRRRLEELTGLDARRAAVEAELATAEAVLARTASRVGEARRRAAAPLAGAVQQVLGELAMGSAVVEVAVDDEAELAGAGGAVELRLAANPGAPLGGLAKVASGGELSRVMLALRLVLTGGPPTMVFDEVDAGVGGEAATAVGGALARLASGRQVLVVTHLPQVAAFADQQLRVAKHADDVVGTTVTLVEVLDDERRVVELSRMLSGSPDSATAQEHANELLGAAGRARGR